MYAKCISLDWEAIAKAIGLSIEETSNLFSDGRISGELLQRIAIRQFHLIPSQNCDLYDASFPKNNKKIEIRLITKHGIKTAPSNQTGAGRKFDEGLYLEKLNEISYFLFLDLRTISNTIPCYLIPSEKIKNFFIDSTLSKSGATTSFKTIALLLLESVEKDWSEGLEDTSKAPSAVIENSETASDPIPPQS